MGSYALITDSSCDLTPELARELDLEILPLSFHMEGKEYHNYLDAREISFSDYYNLLRGGIRCTTSAVNVETFISLFERHLKEGEDVLCLAFSSGLSSTCSAAVVAAEELSRKYPERKVSVVDTLCASLGQGLLIYLAAKERQNGKSMEEVRTFAEQIRPKLCHWFTVDDLNHLKRGGRVSAATALVGTMLNIKPVLHVDDEGHLVNVSKTRGRKAALLALVDKMEETAIEPSKQTVFISHGDCLADAEFVAEEIRKRLGVSDIRINFVGPVIGAHSGPGTMALFYVGTNRN